METNYTLPKQQLFVCCDKEGYVTRINPKGRLEKQQMYIDYPLVIQTGYYSKYSVKLWFNDNTFRLINPGKLRINNPVFITSKKKIDTISLEVSS